MTSWRHCRCYRSSSLFWYGTVSFDEPQYTTATDQPREQKHGLGSHFSTLAPGQYVEVLKVSYPLLINQPLYIKSVQPFWLSVPIYNLSLTTTKLSILIQYLRVFPNDTIRRICWVTVIFISVYGIWTFFGSIFMCTPVSYFWDKSIRNGYCFNELAFWFSNAALNILTDAVIFGIPMPMLKSLNIPKRQKFALMGVFALGGLYVSPFLRCPTNCILISSPLPLLSVCVTSVIRLHSIYIVSISKDVSWDNVGAATWSSVETNVGIICACLPTLKALLARIFPRLLYSAGYVSNAQPQSGLAWSRRKSRGDVRENVMPHVRSHATAAKDAYIMSGLSGSKGGGGGGSGGGGSGGDDDVKDPHHAEGRIKVVTVLAQSVESKSDSESQRGLVWKGTWVNPWASDIRH